MPVAELEIRKVGIFDKIAFTFDPRVNVFVGPNNSGKTTALFTLADILVHPFTFPRKHIREGSTFKVRISAANGKPATLEGPLPILLSEDEYWTDERAKPLKSAQRNLGFRMFVPALRIGTDFRSKGPTVKPQKPKKKSPVASDEPPEFPEVNYSFIADQLIIQDLINLDYQSYRERNKGIRKTIDSIGTVASRIMQGFPVAFAGVDEDETGLSPRFKTPDGQLSVGVLSQGTQGLLLWLTHFIISYARHYKFPTTFSDKPGILVIDEIDAHLHPSWQRRVLPELTSAFPSLQIFCSTQSPLMLAGLERGQVQLLKRTGNHKVVVSRNETDIHGWSADEIYSCFLGIEHPTDIKTNQQLVRLEELRQLKQPTPAQKRELESLRNGVASALQNTPICEDEASEKRSLEAAAQRLISRSKKKHRAKPRSAKPDALR